MTSCKRRTCAEEATLLLRNAETLAYLGEVQIAAGRLRDAVVTLEECVAQPGAPARAGTTLVRARRRSFPALHSLASIDAFFGGEILPVDASSVEDARGHLDDVGDSRARYFESYLLEMQGDLSGTQQELRSLVDGQKEIHPRVGLRLARLVAHEDPDRALNLLERSLNGAPNDFRSWGEWMRVASVGLDWELGDMIERFAESQLASVRENEQGAQGIVVIETPALEPLPESVRWFLQTLESDGVVRISAAGDEDVVDSRGKRWGRDRFFRGGSEYARFRPALRGPGELDRDTYAERRSFAQSQWNDPAYRIPIPVGRYDLVLHFCQSVPGPLRGRFDIEVEGQTVAKDFRLEFARPAKLEFSCDVVDGLFDLEFQVEPTDPPTRWALVSAIEIHRADR